MENGMADVVVGVDGSEQSLLALRHAACEARCRRTRLHAVHVYEPVRDRNVEATAAVVGSGLWSLSASTGTALLSDARRRSEEERAAAQRHAEARLQRWLATAAEDLRSVTVERSVISDEHPSGALLRLAHDADLLVVGSRGLGGFAGVLMGSVSQQCVQHAACPVLVVRPVRGKGWRP